MPRCEGLPDGPCPYGTNNRSVKLAQGDLMLCPRCDLIRFPPASVDSCIMPVNKNDRPRKATNNSKLKMNQPQSVGGTVDVSEAVAPEHSEVSPSQANMDASSAVNFVADVPTLASAVAEIDGRTSPAVVADDSSRTVPCLMNSSLGPVDNEAFRQLQLQVRRQQRAIVDLQTRLAFVLSFLGIDEHDLPLNRGLDCNDLGQPNTPSTHQDIPSVDTANLNDLNAQSAWTEVVKRRQPRQQPNSFQQSVVAAVYIDQSTKKMRETSLIVSGLEPSIGHPDSELFSCLCREEFDIQPGIVKTKRLGKHSPSAGKAQPLLVILREKDQVRNLLASARQLRHSTNPAVRDRIYINPNLTKAEADAAYQLRVKRRQAMQRRAGRSAAEQRPPLPPASDPSHDTSQAAVCSNDAVGGFSALNPLANAFISDVSLQPGSG